MWNYFDEFINGIVGNFFGVYVLQMSTQAGFLGEFFVTEDAEKLAGHVTFVFAMTRQAPQGFVPFFAIITLIFAGDVAGFKANKSAMAIQGVLRGQALAAIGALVWFAGL